MAKPEIVGSISGDGEVSTVYDHAGRFLFICDTEDIPKIKSCKFYKARGGYSQTYINKEWIFAHRLLANAPSGEIVDHISRDTTDNRKCNLRLCTHQQNSFNAKLSKRNTSGIKGVRWDKSRNKWYAYIAINKKLINLGRYCKFDDAVSARKRAALKYFGRFASEAT